MYDREDNTFMIRKPLLKCWFWLSASELLCLVLAFSFAILQQSWARWASLFCCLLAHILIMGNCSAEIAHENIALSHSEKQKASPCFAFQLALLAALPRFLLYGLLWLFSDSVLMLNLYLLLNAPYIQILRFLLNGAEPFSAVRDVSRFCMGLLPFITSISVFAGYSHHYSVNSKEIGTEIHRAKRF